MPPLFPVLLLAAGASDARNLQVDGHWHDLARLPEGLPTDLRALVERERPFAQKHGLRVYASAKSPVAVFSEWSESLSTKLAADAHAVAEEFPRLFPEPSAPPPLPDEELDAVAAGAPFPLYLLDPGPTYAALLDRMAAEHEYLRDWVEKGKNLQGFHLYRPRIVAVLSGSANWDPRNQVVHDVTHVLTYSRYGRQPFWLEEGISWYVEDILRESIFAFCYRANFLWDVEKTGWPRDFADLYRRGGTPPSVDSLPAFRPGTYTAGDTGVKDTRALLAYGLAAFLANERPGEFADVLSAYARDVSEVGEFDPDYEIPPETQLKVLRETLGSELAARLAAFASRIGNRMPRPKPSEAAGAKRSVSPAGPRGAPRAG